MIECRDIEYFYEDYRFNRFEVLAGVNFKIGKGERVLLLGVNGSGKSTLLKILNGLIFPQSGEYLFKGERVDKRYLKKAGKSFRRSVVLQMQDPASMLFNATVKDEIAFGLKHFGFDDAEDRAAEWAKRFDLAGILDRSPLSLSGGERQKVLLASLLSIEPEVLLMDEPTAHLDPPATGWLVDMLKELDVTSLIATHNLSLGREMGERAIVLGADHKVCFDGETEALLSDLSTLVSARLVHKHSHRHGDFEHEHFHLHMW